MFCLFCYGTIDSSVKSSGFLSFFKNLIKNCFDFKQFKTATKWCKTSAFYIYQSITLITVNKTIIIYYLHWNRLAFRVRSQFLPTHINFNKYQCQHHTLSLFSFFILAPKIAQSLLYLLHICIALHDIVYMTRVLNIMVFTQSY